MGMRMLGEEELGGGVGGVGGVGVWDWGGGELLGRISRYGCLVGGQRAD